MGRLYYEQASAPVREVDTEELEVNLPERTPEVKTPEAGGEMRSSSINSHLEKVASLIPGEVIAAYLAMFGLVPMVKNEAMHTGVFWAIFGLCLVATPIYLNTQAEKNKPKRNHLIVSTLAFLVWAYATTGSTLIPDFHDVAISSIALIAFSMFSAVVPMDK